jgi:uncharacterized protein YegP (UPF0339 family)
MTIEIYRGTDGRYRWHRKAPNGQVTAQGQAHTFKWNAKRAARKLFPYDPVVDLTKQTGSV